MATSFLEDTLLGACPTFRPDWVALRGAYGRIETPSASHFLAALRLHLLGLLRAGDVVAFTRLAQTLERLLAEADPILEELLVRELVMPLAADVRAAGVSRALAEPHLGRRTRAAWERGMA